MILIAAPLVTRHLSLVIKQWERCQSGRSSTLGKRVYRKVPRVRIPPSPPGQIRRYAQNTEKARKHCVCGPFSFLWKTAKKRQKTHKNTQFFFVELTYENPLILLGFQRKGPFRKVALGVSAPLFRQEKSIKSLILILSMKKSTFTESQITKALK